MRISEEEQRALLLAAKQYDESAVAYVQETGDPQNDVAYEHRKLARILRALEVRLRNGK